MLKTVFWGFVLFLALSFFGISLRAIIESPIGQENLLFISQVAVQFWHWLILVFEVFKLRLFAAVAAF